MRKNIILFTLATFLISSCLATISLFKARSFSDPDFRNKLYNNYCCSVTFPEQMKSMDLEEFLVENIRDTKTQAIEASMLIPPTRKWNEENIHKELLKYNVDAYLKIEMNYEFAYTKHYDAKEVSSTETNFEKDSTGELISKEKITTRKLIPAKSYDRYYINVKAELIDVATSRVAWTGMLKSKDVYSEEYINWELMRSFSNDICNELKKCSHLRKDK